MTSVVFPEAKVKIFLNASVEERASRRFKQLILKEKDVNLAHVTEQIKLRDSRDRDRPISPLIISDNAYILETDKLSIKETVEKILHIIKNKLGSE
jgi:cytidylate kinase